MGELADDIIDGVICAFCMNIFLDKNEEVYEHGYPVACNACWEEDCGYQKQDPHVHTH